VDNLEETYDAWLQTAERMIRDGIPNDVIVEKIDIDVEEVCVVQRARTSHEHSVTGALRFRTCAPKTRNILTPRSEQIVARERRERVSHHD
jgi:hypothetical protein